MASDVTAPGPAEEASVEMDFTMPYTTELAQPPPQPQVSDEVRRMRAKQKSRRRSSLSRGRKSVNPAQPPEDLWTNVDGGLSRDAQLAMFCKSAINRTLETLRPEFGEVDEIKQVLTANTCRTANSHASDLLNFALSSNSATIVALVSQLQLELQSQQLATCSQQSSISPAAVDRMLGNLTDTGYFKRTTQSCGESSTSKELSLLDEYLQKLRKESCDWDALLEHHNRMAEEAERRCVPGAGDLITGANVTLSARQRLFLSKAPDYRGIAVGMQHTKERNLLQAKELEQSLKLAHQFFTNTSSAIEKQAKLIHEYSFAGIQDFDDPKRLILNVVEQPTIFPARPLDD